MEQKKQVIRLTEQDLHNIITESVKQALNELDWKTYANAARKQNSIMYDKYSRDGDSEKDVYKRAYGSPEYKRKEDFEKKRDQAFFDK